MQRGLLARLICRAARGSHIPLAHSRVTVVLKHLQHSNAFLNTMAFSIIERGRPNTEEYRIFYKGLNGTILSPFHDIPLFHNGEGEVLNMVVEIPRWTNAKMEISKEEPLNPIKQDIKKEKLRYVKNIFPHHGYIWNYGALPQTWEDPDEKHKFPETGTKGDNDPLDICEIGQKVHARGAVIQVKVLGTMLLVDEGETDWKVIAIDVTDPLASKLNDIDDVHKEMPGFLRATYEWFRYYKVPDGKPENTVHWCGECKNKEFAMKVVREANKYWKDLMSNPTARAETKISCINTTVAGCPEKVANDKAQEIVNKSKPTGPAAPIDSAVDKWYYPIPAPQASGSK